MTATVLGLSGRDKVRRQTGIGASEVPAVVGIVPGAIDVYARKVGEAPEFEGNSLTEFGHRIEDVIGDAWLARHEGVRIYTPGTLRHQKHAWALASPDRVVAPPGTGRPPRESWLELLEIKTVFFSGSQFGEGSDEVPDRHLVQVQWQLEVTGMERATLVALVNGDYREYPMERDRELGAMLVDQVGKFWTDHVLARVPPPVDGSAAYGEYLRRRHPRDSGVFLEPTAETEALVAHLREAKETLRQAELLEAEAKQQLQTVLGDASGITGLCTWKSNKDSQKVDWEGIARNLAVGQEDRFKLQLAQHTTTKPGARVLRLSKGE